MGFKIRVLPMAALLAVLPLAASAKPPSEAKPEKTAEEPLYYFCMAGLGSSNRFYVTPVMRETWKYDPLGLVLKQPVNYSWKQAVGKIPLANVPHCEHGTKESAEKARQSEIEQVTRFKRKVVYVEWHYGQTGPARIVSDTSPAPDVKKTNESKGSGEEKPAQGATPPADSSRPLLRH